MRRINVFEKVGDGNALNEFYRSYGSLRLVFNSLVASACGFVPIPFVRIWGYRFIGMKLGNGISLGRVYLDLFFPEKIEIGDDCILGLGAIVLAHEFVFDQRRIGAIKIGKRVTIGANAIILPGVSIGDDAVVGAGAVVTRDVASKTFVAGVPASVVQRERAKQAKMGES